MPELTTDIRYIKGVGEQRAKALGRLGIRTLGDLLRYFPRAYEDRTVVRPIAELLPEEETDKPAPPDAEEPAGEPADGAAEETADEAPAGPEPEMPEPETEPEEPETPDGAEDVSELLPEEESFPEEAEEAAEAEKPAEEPEE